MRNIPETIKHLLVINILFFIGAQFLGGISNDLLALHYFKNDKFIITQVITHMFMHGNFYQFFRSKSFLLSLCLDLLSQP